MKMGQNERKPRAAQSDIRPRQEVETDRRRVRPRQQHGSLTERVSSWINITNETHNLTHKTSYLPDSVIGSLVNRRRIFGIMSSIHETMSGCSAPS